MAAKSAKKKWEVFVLLSDGELNEGSNWEATLFASHHNLNNLTTDLSQKLEDINPIIEGANDMITTLNKVNFENTFNQIDILLTSMNGVFDDLESGEGGTLSLLLSDDSLYNNLNQTAYDLDKLLQHINENPKHFFAPLGKSRKKIERDLKKQKED